jgi:hypothetical protein
VSREGIPAGVGARKDSRTSVQVGDMNNDGWQDIVTSNNDSHTISVLLQIPDTDCDPDG